MELLLGFGKKTCYTSQDPQSNSDSKHWVSDPEWRWKTKMSSYFAWSRGRWLIKKILSHPWTISTLKSHCVQKLQTLVVINKQERTIKRLWYFFSVGWQTAKPQTWIIECELGRTLPDCPDLKRHHSEYHVYIYFRHIRTIYL